MSQELQYAQNPRRFNLRWYLFYAALVLGIVSLFVAMASNFRTYSLPRGAVSLTIPYSKYLVGEAVTFTIANHYNSPIYIQDDCPSEPLAVYRQESLSWVRVHDTTSLASCSNKERQIEIAPGEQRQGSFAQWPNLFSVPGKYRVAVLVDYFNDILYQDFEVVSKPVPAPVTPPTSQAPSATITPSAHQQTVSLAEGSITVSYAGSYITVLSISPAAGCTYEGGRSGTQVEVTFICGGNNVQLQLQVINGQLRQKLESD